jgi:hypothetical protein
MNTYTELISKYINGELSAAEKTTFEAELKSNVELKKEYELQLNITKGAERMGLKNQMNTSFKKVKVKKIITKGLIGLTIAVAVLGAVIAVKNTADKPVSRLKYELNEQGSTNWSEADKKLESQVFQLNPERDTIIETQQGIVIAVPAHAFKQANGNVPTKTIDLEIKEAMTAAQIMNAGLSTKSNDKLLETGGMFYINAREGTENLVIDQSKPLNVNVPVNNNKNDMMLFKGERTADGGINWTDPKPMKRKLSTVDMTKLNFYPNHFLDTLKILGFNTKNKKLTDSIYYSYSGYCGIHEPSKKIPVADTLYDPSGKPFIMYNNITNAIKDSSASVSVGKPRNRMNENCEIDPSRIKVIWNKNFNRTILATKEFEERLKVIFTTCDSRIFNLYVNNLDKNLYEIDSMAANLLSGDLRNKFLEFSARKDGGVDISDSQNKQLQAYFEEKRAIYTKAITATLQKMYDSEAEKSQAAFNEFMKHQNSENIRTNKTFNEELEINLDEAYKQLGYKRPNHDYTGGTNQLTNHISAPITQTGWSNVDRYVYEATENRSTLNYKDPRTGKTAYIAYKPVSVNVENYKYYDRIVCYIIPDRLSSFQTMKNTGTTFHETLNELMGYSIVTIGFKGEQRYYNELKQAQPKDYNVSLKSIKPEALDQLLNSSFPLNQPADLAKEIDYQVFDMKETVRQNKIAKRETVRYRLLPIVLPCASPPIGEDSLPLR